MSAIDDAITGATSPARSLLIIGSGGSWTAPLPDIGDLTIGSAPDCHVVIDQSEVCPTHAALHVTPQRIAVEDLGSARGTWVRDRLIPPRLHVPVACGETIELGAAMLVVKRNVLSGSPPPLMCHGAFRRRLRHMQGRARRVGGELALLRIWCEASSPADALDDSLQQVLGDVAAAGYLAPGEYEAAICAGASAARACADRIAGALRERGVETRIGLAVFPHDGDTVDELLEIASHVDPGDSDGKPADGGPVIGSEGAMDAIYRLARRVASSSLSVLLLGETGVGKDVVAGVIHRQSLRADAPLVRLNCATLSETLLASELFGYERGAFTGALATKPGLLETAQGGTIFLDEVGELPLSLQAQILHVLEHRQVQRLGGLHPRPIDVRFISATNRTLDVEVERGTFRRDLFYRLNGASVVIPPLRERRDEILPLARHFVCIVARPTESGAPSIGAAAAALLEAHDWPGNIRELRNVVERAAVLCKGPTILPEHLALPRQARSAPAALAPPTDPAQQERARIMKALQACAGNQTQAARVLGISRRTLINRLIEYGIRRPRKHAATPVQPRLASGDDHGN
jgi:DNA-binding NtrC family response regulator